MKINIPTRGEVELTDLLKESSELRTKSPHIVVNSLVRELIDAIEVIDKLTRTNTNKEIELSKLKEENSKQSIELTLHRNNAKVLREMFFT